MSLSFAWHLQQPVGRDPKTREDILPGAGFHAVKDYYQRAALLEETEYSCTYNFVPFLMEQLDECAGGTANGPYGAALEENPDGLPLVFDARCAEGSAWFWWYGEDGREVCAELFRAHLRRAHGIAGTKESS